MFRRIRLGSDFFRAAVHSQVDFLSVQGCFDGSTVLPRIIGILLLFVLAAASYSSELPEYPVQPASAYANKVVDPGLIVAIEVVGDTEQQKKYFNSNLNSRGILPVLVVIQNTSTEKVYLFDKSAVALGNTTEAIGKGALKTGALLGSGGLLDVTTFAPGQMRMALTSQLYLCVLVAFQSVAVLAQEPEPALTTPPRAAVETTQPRSPQNSTGILKDGTPVKLRLLKTLDSRSAKNGDEIQFEVVNHLVVGGVIVLRRGSLATGVVSQAEASKTVGRGGRLSFTINDIKLRNESKLSVRAFNQARGENLAGGMVVPMLVAPMEAAPFFLIMHGANTVFPRGTEINAFANGDLRLELDSFAPAPSETPGSEPKTVLPDKLEVR